MRTLLSIVLAAFGAAANAQITAPHWRGSAAEWSHDVPCLIAVQANGNCVPMSDGRTICRHYDDVENVDRVTIEQDGRLLHQWPIEIGTPPAYDIGAHFFRADLDADGAPEIILSTVTAVSNGFAIETVEVDVIDGRDTALPPLRFAVEDFDPAVSFLRAPQSDRCRAFTTEWSWSFDRKRGAGNYLVGQWFDYHASSLTPARSRPVLARRRLISFGREIANGAGNMYDWLRDSRAETLIASPPIDDADEPKTQVLKGVLHSIADDGVTVIVGSSKYVISKDWVRVIDDATGRMLPASYEPAPGVLAQRRVAITAHGWPPARYTDVMLRVGRRE